MMTFVNNHFQHIRISDESFVEKLKRITCEKKKARGNLVCERERELQHHESLAIVGQ
jgi:hypothetical protein